MEHLTDFTSEQLLTALRIGDCGAFNEIYRRYRKKVYGYAYHFVRCAEEAEELTQDVFVRLWENRLKIDLSKNFDAFLYTIIRNNFLEALRRKARISVFQKESQNGQSALNCIENYIDFKDSQYITLQAIETLSPQVKMAYLLSRNNGHSHEDISLKMGISKNTVNNHIKKSLGIIRKHFKDHSPETILSLLLLTLF